MTKLTRCPSAPEIPIYIQELVSRFNWEICADKGPLEDNLHWDGKLSYCANISEQKPISFCFERMWDYHKKSLVSISKEPLAKAIGIKKGKELSVLDGTCGTGKDLILMCFFGATVTGYERNPIVYSLLADALARAQASALYKDIFKNLKINFGDFSSANIKSYDVVFLDPMYPTKKKKALSRKEMQIFKKLVGSDEDASELFHKAIEISKGRVIVKRPIHGNELSCGVHNSYKGKSTRYDMYLVHSE